MRKISLYIVGTLLVVGYLTFITLPEIMDSIKPKSVATGKYGSIVRLTRDGMTFCTGTVIQPNLIVTAAHCVLIETPFGAMLGGKMEIRPGTNVPTGVTAFPVFANQQMDQALLAGDFSRFDTRPYITNPTELTKIKNANKTFTSCGYPLAGDLYCTTTVYDHPENFYWAVKGVLIPGMSGGPTMIHGVVVAVNTAVEGPNSIVSPIYNVTMALKQRLQAESEKGEK